MTPRWLKRLRKRQKREAAAALTVMEWKLQEQKQQIDAQFRRQPCPETERFWRGDGWKGWV